MTALSRRPIRAYSGIMSNTRLMIALGATTVLLMAGCTSDDGSSGGPSTVTVTSTRDGTVTPSDPPPATGIGSGTGTAEPAPTGSVPVSHPASSGARLSVTGVRVGHHNAFDRVVFDLGGTGTPGWRVDYTDSPAQPGSGKPITVSGDSVLQVILTGLGYPMDTGVEEYSGPNPITGVHNVPQVHLTGVFEGEAVGFIGINGERPAVRVTALTNPTRLVIDIAHAG